MTAARPSTRRARRRAAAFEPAGRLVTGVEARGPAARTARPHRKVVPAGAVRTATAAVLVLLAAVVAPPAAPIVLALVVAVPHLRERRRARQRARRIRADLPEVAEVLALAVEAGLTVGAAIAIAVEHLDGPLVDDLAIATREVAVGRRLADALDRSAARLGDDARPLVVVLADSERAGVAVAPTLRRLAADARDRRRRDAEEAARRLPVKLLFPLVGCVLPAFVLLTVVPVVAGALRAVRL